MNIAILSRNTELYSTQSLIKAARKRHHFVRVFDHMQCDIVMDKGQSRLLYNGYEIQGYDAVIPRIGNSATSYGAAVVRQFEMMGVFTTLQAEALLRSRDKLSSMQIMAGSGLGVPRTAVSNNLLSYSQMLDEVGEAPYIVKLANGTHGLGVILSESKSNAESILEAFHRSGKKILIQNFVKESKGADVRVFIVDGEIVGVMKRQAAAGEFRSNLHRGGSSCVIKLTAAEEEAAVKAADLMGLKVAGVDMLQSYSGPLILEVNASPGLEGIETTTGNDIGGKIIEYIEKNYYDKST